MQSQPLREARNHAPRPASALRALVRPRTSCRQSAALRPPTGEHDRPWPPPPPRPPVAACRAARPGSIERHVPAAKPHLTAREVNPVAHSADQVEGDERDGTPGCTRMRETRGTMLPHESQGGPICQPLPLTAAERAQLLSRIDREMIPASIAERRTHPRLRYRGKDMVATIQHPGGGIVRSYVMPVDLSAGGVCLLRNGFLHKGTHASLDLSARDGELLTVTGDVAWCNQFYGRIHRVGIRFDCLVDPRLFVDARVWENAVSTLPGINDTLTGRVLCIEDQELDRELLRMYLEETALELLLVSSADEARKAVRSRLFDLLLCDLNLGEVRGEEFIRECRRHGFAGSVIAVTIESDPRRLEAARLAGADEVIGKPYERNALLHLIRQELGRIDELARSEPIYSDLPNRKQMARLIQKYVEGVQTKVIALSEAIAADNLEHARTICQTIRGTGTGYGYAPLAEAAARAQRALDGSMSIEESLPQLRQLQMVVTRLAVVPRGE